jgi:carboxyl-terminal processing protease
VKEKSGRSASLLRHLQINDIGLVKSFYYKKSGKIFDQCGRYFFKQQKRKQHIMKLKFLTFIAALGIFISCKKNDTPNPNPSPNPNPQPGVITPEMIKDSTLIYSKDLYLWYSQIPTAFNARTYAGPGEIMTAIRNYSNEQGFNQPVDRWSFAMKQDEWDGVSGGAALDFGMNVFFKAEGDLRVRYVEKSSPAGLAGIRRGWQITKINGSTNIATSNADYIINAVYYSSASSFSFKKPDGSVVDINLNGAAYQDQPIVFDSVYNAGTKKVGYFVFNSFLGDTTNIYNQFQRIFNRFASENVNEVAIDLRYNGGGYVTVQEKLANYLISASGNGQLMMTQQFNNKYTQYNESTLFQKKGTLNLDRVFFIVSNSTASASELLINNLKPFMQVVLVGPSRTHGKPVGFFPIPIGDWYIFPVSFRTVNKNGEGNYFDGFALNNQVADGLDKDWGDVNESAFASVLRYVSSGAFRLQAMEQPSEQVVSANKALDQPFFKGTVDVMRRF